MQPAGMVTILLLLMNCTGVELLTAVAWFAKQLMQHRLVVAHTMQVLLQYV